MSTPVRTPARARLAALLAGLFAAAASIGCINTTPPGAVISSFPPGARVMLDGKDSGYVTPCVIGLDRGDSYRVEIELDGYQTFRLRMEQETKRTIISWGDSHIWPGDSFRFPLFLPALDLLFPLRVDHSHSPARVHVRLDPTAQ